MAKPNRYVLGTTTRIISTPKDTNGIFFVPTESRLSIKQPDGVIVTYSGGDMSVITSGYLYVDYKGDTVGWYQYEAWVKDGAGTEKAETAGFELYDKVYP